MQKIVNLGLDFRKLSVFTNLSKQRIEFKKGEFNTLYFAQKAWIKTGLTVFQNNPGIDFVFVRVPFSDGFVEGEISRADVREYFELEEQEGELDGVGKKTFAISIRTYVGEKAVMRLSRYVRPGSKFESFLASITKNKTFTNK